MSTKPHRRSPGTALSEGKAGQPASRATDRFVAAAVPHLPLPAILGFAITGLGGALFLAFSTFQSADGIESRRLQSKVPVYSARAVPRDPDDADLGKVLSLAQRTGLTDSPARHEKTSEAAVLSPSPKGDLPGFSGFSGFNAANTFLALAAANLTSGLATRPNSGGHFAADSETEIVSMVPESSTWLCGLGLTLLVGARSARASWRRRSRSRSLRESA